jgi:hypothetical protein
MHAKCEEARSLEYRKAWRAARAENRRMPAPRKRIAPRLPLPAITTEELARIGSIDGLLPSNGDN